MRRIACMVLVACAALGCHGPMRADRVVATLSTAAGTSRVVAPTREAGYAYGSADYWLVAPSGRIEYESDRPFGVGLQLTFARFGLMRADEDYLAYGVVHPDLLVLAIAPYFHLDLAVFDLEIGFSTLALLSPRDVPSDHVGIWPYLRVQYVARSGHGMRAAFLSSDYFLADPNLLSIAYVYRGGPVRIAVGGGAGIRTVPDLAPNEELDEGVYVGGIEEPLGELYGFLSLAFRLHPTVALLVGVAGGRQLPIGTLGLRFAPRVADRDVLASW